MSRIRILHLEADPTDAGLARSRLEQAGLAVEIDRAADRAAFAAALPAGAHDLVLVADGVPDLDAPAAVELARSARPRTPVVVVSGTPGEEVAVEAMRRGAADYVLRQRIDRLAPAVQRALTEAQARAARERDRLSQLAHDLRNPLNAVLGWVALLKTGKLTPEKVTEALDVIERNVKAQAKLIDEAVAKARAEDNGGGTTPKPG